MKKALVFSLIVLSFILLGCSSTSQKEAESIAQGFVDQNVKFFSQQQGVPETLGSVNEPTVMSHREGELWIVIIHVSSEVNGTMKQGDLIVKVDKKGEVVEFNGKKL
jgi:hypothetical protein